MADLPEVGARLHARYQDGVFYAAEVIAVSASAKRAKAPVKVQWNGYDESAWVSLEDLKSKNLKSQKSSNQNDTGAKASILPEVGAKLLACYSDGTFYPAEVLATSPSSAKPVKVQWLGYKEKGWCSLDEVKISDKKNKSQTLARGRSRIVSLDCVAEKAGRLAVLTRYRHAGSIQDAYELEQKVLGEGSTGTVQLATSRGVKYAIKHVLKDGLDKNSLDLLKAEVEIYLSLDHPNIVKLEQVFETRECMHLVMECMDGGELYERLTSAGHYSEGVAASTMRQMILAMYYLHSHNVAHRDLKPENFLYTAKDSDHLKLADFGFASRWGPGKTMSAAIGSPDFIAPEILSGSYTEKVDMWSLGIIAVEMMTGSTPWEGSRDEVLEKISEGKPQYPKSFWQLSEQCRDFVSKLLEKDATKRLSAAEAMIHPWVTSGVEDHAQIDSAVRKRLQSFARAPRLRRACLSMMAWSLSGKEREEYESQFAALDRDGNGTVTLDELKLALASSGGDLGHMEAEQLFKSLDMNGDGEIGFTEFLAAVLPESAREDGALVHRAFDHLDADGSGVITAEELSPVVDGSPESKQELETDMSGKSSLTLDDFKACLLGQKLKTAS